MVVAVLLLQNVSEGKISGDKVLYTTVSFLFIFF